MNRPLPGYHNVITMYPDEVAFTARKTTPANFATARTEAPVVDLSPPPAWAARRRQMRRDGLQLIMCVVFFAVLVGFALTPDTAVMRAQVEAYQ